MATHASTQTETVRWCYNTSQWQSEWGGWLPHGVTHTYTIWKPNMHRKTTVRRPHSVRRWHISENERYLRNSSMRVCVCAGTIWLWLWYLSRSPLHACRVDSTRVHSLTKSLQHNKFESAVAVAKAKKRIVTQRKNAPSVYQHTCLSVVLYMTESQFILQTFLISLFGELS